MLRFTQSSWQNLTTKMIAGVKENCRTSRIWQNRIERTRKFENIHNFARVDKNNLINETEPNCANFTILQWCWFYLNFEFIFGKSSFFSKRKNRVHPLYPEPGFWNFVPNWKLLFFRLKKWKIKMISVSVWSLSREKIVAFRNFRNLFYFRSRRWSSVVAELWKTFQLTRN